MEFNFTLVEAFLFFTTGPSAIHPLFLMAVANFPHLFFILDKILPKPCPSFERNSNSITVRWPHLTYLQENSIFIRAHIKVEPFIVHSERSPLWEFGWVVVPASSFFDVPFAIVFDQLNQGIAKLNHALGWEDDGLLLAQAVAEVTYHARAPQHGLPNPQEAAPLVLLQVKVILPIVPLYVVRFEDTVWMLFRPHRDGRGGRRVLLASAGALLFAGAVLGPVAFEAQVGVVLDEVP